MNPKSTPYTVERHVTSKAIQILAKNGRFGNSNFHIYVYIYMWHVSEGPLQYMCMSLLNTSDIKDIQFSKCKVGIS